MEDKIWTAVYLFIETVPPLAAMYYAGWISGKREGRRAQKAKELRDRINKAFDEEFLKK